MNADLVRILNELPYSTRLRVETDKHVLVGALQDVNIGLLTLSGKVDIEGNKIVKEGSLLIPLETIRLVLYADTEE